MRRLPDRYATVRRRDFRAALEYLLETEYKLVGSHRVIRLISEAVLELQRQFCPEYQQLEPGTILWATTQAGELTPTQTRVRREQDQCLPSRLGGLSDRSDLLDRRAPHLG